jgi:glycosyltransferase involved in cell wall biosynthesis
VRIAIVAANREIVGGVETYVRWLLAALVARGHDVAFAFERAATQPERAVDRGTTALALWDMQALGRTAFFEEVTAFCPDVVYLQGGHDPTLDFELAERFCCVLFAHVFYGACATGWRVHRLPQLQVCERRFGPACLAINYLRGCGARNPMRLLEQYSGQRERAKVLPHLAGLIVASEYMRAVFLQHGVPDHRIHVIPLPAELPPDAAPPAAHASRTRVLFLGRVTVAKGAARAIEVVARCQRQLGRPLHLTLAGDGADLARCRRLALGLGVETDFVGWAGPERRLELLRGADVLIVPSLWPEPFGIVGIEAASVGLPAVAYPVGGIVGWLRPGESGELADGEQFSSEGLARALERTLRDPEHYQRLRVGAWRVAHEFSGELHLSRLEPLLQQAVRRRGAEAP